LGTSPYRRLLLGRKTRRVGLFRSPPSQTRRCRAAALYEVETGFREEGWPSEEFDYDREHDLYRFAYGELAFSREYANERRLREMGCIG
jgi:hypothetical protein